MTFIISTAANNVVATTRTDNATKAFTAIMNYFVQNEGKPVTINVWDDGTTGMRLPFNYIVNTKASAYDIFSKIFGNQARLFQSNQLDCDNEEDENE